MNWNRYTHKRKFCMHLLSKNGVNRGTQESKCFFFFSLGTVVQDSLIQCLWWLHITELTAKMRVDTIYLEVPINLLKQEYWLINVKCLNNVKWIMNILKNLTTETNIPKNFPPFGMFIASLFIYFYIFIYYHSE